MGIHHLHKSYFPDDSALVIVGEPEIKKLEKKWPESSRILDYILS